MDDLVHLIDGAIKDVVTIREILPAVIDGSLIREIYDQFSESQRSSGGYSESASYVNQALATYLASLHTEKDVTRRSLIVIQLIILLLGFSADCGKWLDKFGPHRVVANSLVGMLRIRSHGVENTVGIDPPSHKVAALRVHHNQSLPEVVEEDVDMGDSNDDDGVRNTGDDRNSHVGQEEISFPTTPNSQVNEAGYGGSVENDVDDQIDLTLMGDLLLAEIPTDSDRESHQDFGEDLSQPRDLGKIVSRHPDWTKNVYLRQILLGQGRDKYGGDRTFGPVQQNVTFFDKNYNKKDTFPTLTPLNKRPTPSRSAKKSVAQGKVQNGRIRKYKLMKFSRLAGENIAGPPKRKTLKSRIQESWKELATSMPLDLGLEDESPFAGLDFYVYRVNLTQTHAIYDDKMEEKVQGFEEEWSQHFYGLDDDKLHQEFATLQSELQQGQFTGRMDSPMDLARTIEQKLKVNEKLKVILEFFLFAAVRVHLHVDPAKRQEIESLSYYQKEKDWTFRTLMALCRDLDEKWHHRHFALIVHCLDEIGIGKLKKWFAPTVRPLAFHRLLDYLERRELPKLYGDCETILDHLEKLFCVIPGLRAEHIKAGLDWFLPLDKESSAHGDSGYVSEFASGTVLGEGDRFAETVRAEVENFAEILEQAEEETGSLNADLVRQLAPGMSLTAELVDFILRTVEPKLETVFISATLYPKLKDDLDDDLHTLVKNLPQEGTEWRMPISECGSWVTATIVWDEAIIWYYGSLKLGTRQRRKEVVKTLMDWVQKIDRFLIPRAWKVKDQEGIRLDQEQATESGTVSTLMLALNAFGAQVNSSQQVLSFARYRLDFLKMMQQWHARHSTSSAVMGNTMEA